MMTTKISLNMQLEMAEAALEALKKVHAKGGTLAAMAALSDDLVAWGESVITIMKSLRLMQVEPKKTVDNVVYVREVGAVVMIDDAIMKSGVCFMSKGHAPFVLEFKERDGRPVPYEFRVIPLTGGEDEKTD